jgi:hypothetical protein
MLTVLITNYKTIDFLKLSLYGLEKLTKNSYKVLINDNGSSEDEINELKNLEQKYDYIKVNFRKTDSIPSYAHGEALDILIPIVDTKYFVVLDSDCTFLLKDWDEVLISDITDDIKIIGTPYYTSSTSHKKGDFPAQFAVLFETETYRNLDISCMPENLKEKDTCWEWREKYLSNGMESHIFSQINTRYEKDKNFIESLCIAYYYKNRLIASHYGRGSSGGSSKKLRKSYYKIPIIGDFLKKRKAILEKNIWFEEVKNIINNQLQGV